MKALVCDSYGSLDCVNYRDIAAPLPGPDDILVAVKAAGAMFTDILFAEGKYSVVPPLPFILGSEVAGEVVAMGQNVTRFKAGDRITSLAINFGGFAEQVVLPAWLPSHLPDSIPYDIGAALMSSSATAQHALRQRVALQPNETLVVTGAAGGTGSAAVQIGKILGANVIAVCSSEARAEFCRALGADETIVYTATNLKQAIKDLTAGRGADVVFETTGGDVFDACASSMAIGGRLAVVGFASGRLPMLQANLLIVKHFAAIGVHWLTFVKREPAIHAQNMLELMSWLQAGVLSPAVTTVMPLRDGAAALKRLANGELMGKLVLKPGGGDTGVPRFDTYFHAP